MVLILVLYEYCCQAKLWCNRLSLGTSKLPAVTYILCFELLTTDYDSIRSAYYTYMYVLFPILHTTAIVRWDRMSITVKFYDIFIVNTVVKIKVILFQKSKLGWQSLNLPLFADAECISHWMISVQNRKLC